MVTLTQYTKLDKLEMERLLHKKLHFSDGEGFKNSRCPIVRLHWSRDIYINIMSEQGFGQLGILHNWNSDMCRHCVRIYQWTHR